MYKNHVESVFDHRYEFFTFYLFREKIWKGQRSHLKINMTGLLSDKRGGRQLSAGEAERKKRRKF